MHKNNENEKLTKAKEFLKKQFSKKGFTLAIVFSLVYGLVAIFSGRGILNTAEIQKNTQTISLPELKEPEEIFKDKIEDKPSLEIIRDINEEAEEKEQEKSKNAEGIKENFDDAEEVLEVFNEDEPAFSPRLPDGKILNDYTGEKLIKSKTMNDWRVHRGIDIEMAVGTDVASIEDGKVLKVFDDKQYGKTVIIEHTGGYSSVYSNLDDEVLVEAEMKVKKGDIIGKTGNSAKAEKEEAPHLHFEIVLSGEQINPYELK